MRRRIQCVLFMRWMEGSLCINQINFFTNTGHQPKANLDIKRLSRQLKSPPTKATVDDTSAKSEKALVKNSGE